jgi:hypothetical protein
MDGTQHGMCMHGDTGEASYMMPSLGFAGPKWWTHMGLWKPF